VVSFFTNGFKGMMEAFGDFGEWASGIGKNILEGLVSGLEAGWDWVFEKVSWVADKIKSVFKKALDINSPSRVFKGYGINTMEGYGDGVENQKSSVMSKMTGMANIIKNSFDNVNPVINPIDINGPKFGGPKGQLSTPEGMLFNPNITMHVSIADTGEKGAQQLTNEMKGITKVAVKDGMIDQFMKDAFRL
jgi:hypothetical protein